MFTGGAELEFEVYIRTQYIQIVVKSHCPSDAPVVNVPSPTLVFSIPLPCPSYRPLSQSLTLSLGYSPSEYLWIPSNKLKSMHRGISSQMAARKATEKQMEGLQLKAKYFGIEQNILVLTYILCRYSTTLIVLLQSTISYLLSRGEHVGV